MAVYIYYYQYNLCMYDLYMFIRYVVSITQVLKDTYFGPDNWYECRNLFYNCRKLHTDPFISLKVHDMLI
jgi:hypothetical protein